MAELDPAVQAAMRRIEAGRKEHEKRQSKFDEAYNVYRATSESTGGEPWQSKLRVKYGMQVIDTALVNIVNGQPRVVVKPRQPGSEKSAKAMQMVLDYFVAEDHLVEKQPVFVQQGLIYGVTVAKNSWAYKEGDLVERQFLPNPGDPMRPYVEGDPKRVKTILRDGPCFTPWNVYQSFWTPGAVDVDDAQYVVLQSWLSKDELEKKRYNPDTKLGLYHNLDDLYKSGEGQQPNMSAQDRANGISSSERFRGKFLIEEIWMDDQLITVGNRQVLLRAQPNPYWHGKKPIVIAQTRPDLFEMVGIPETELVDHIQQASQTLQNMVIDNLHLTVMRGITYREGGVTDPNALELRPRFKWPVSDHDDVKPFEVSPISSDVFNERQRLMQDMQLVTGINPYISGGGSEGVDQNTATGITALQEVASRLLRFKAGQIHYKGYQRSFEMWGDMTQQFLDRDIAVKITGDSGHEEWVSVGPQDVVGHYNYTLDGSEESLSRQQERGEAVNLLNSFAPLAGLGIVNWKPILERVASAYGFANPESLIAPQQQAPQAAPYGGQQQQQPQPGPQAQQLLGGQTLDPRIAQAITNGR